MREIKFRAWDKLDGMKYFEFYHLTIGSVNIDHGVYDVPIMQYTGLKDKNGKEIYEGDIGKAFHFGTRKVTFETGMFKFGAVSLNTVTNAGVDFRCEIIGNIYENPELIKS